MSTIEPGYWDVALAASLILVSGGLSLYLRLAVERRLIVAALRMTVQLILVGLVLKALFAAVSPLWTALTALVMAGVAGYEIRSRLERRFAGWWSYGLGTTGAMTAGFLVTVFALLTQIRAEPWYDPRYAIPLLGMILGNAMTGIALGLNTLTIAAQRERNGIEARLALGADRYTALSGVARNAVRSALIPTINSMAAAGLVSLPGMMTGQILAGADPIVAVKYQLLILFLIAGGSTLGVTTAVYLGVRRLSDERHRLRLDRLVSPLGLGARAQPAQPSSQGGKR